MAKQITQCGCGGSFDGTPSGKSKHIATAKHVGWETGKRTAAKLVAVAAKNPGAASPEAIEAFVMSSPDPDVTAAAADIVSAQAGLMSDLTLLITDLTLLITEKEQELARRQIDHKYRERHATADAAAAYFASKIIPLKGEIEVLRAARKALGGAK